MRAPRISSQCKLGNEICYKQRTLGVEKQTSAEDSVSCSAGRRYRYHSVRLRFLKMFRFRSLKELDATEGTVKLVDGTLSP